MQLDTRDDIIERLRTDLRTSSSDKTIDKPKESTSASQEASFAHQREIATLKSESAEKELQLNRLRSDLHRAKDVCCSFVYSL